MSNFKFGDRVRYIPNGEAGTIHLIKSGDKMAHVLFDEQDEVIPVFVSNLEPASNSEYWLVTIALEQRGTSGWYYFSHVIKGRPIEYLANYEGGEHYSSPPNLILAHKITREEFLEYEDRIA